MFFRKALFGFLVFGLVGPSLATAPVNLGQISLNLVAYTNNDGTFEWQVDGTSTYIFTYCMSTNNYIGGNPQVYYVWSIAGASAVDIQTSGILLGNNMPGLTPTNFLEAAAQAESFGFPYGIAAQDNLNNFAVHTTESFGDITFDGQDYSNFFYLQPANVNGGGQPQGYVGDNPPPVHRIIPEPASMATLAVGLITILKRRKRP